MSTRSSDIAKRAIDLVIAIVALVFFAPVFVVVAIAIVADTGMPVFFRQVRAGRGGIPFMIWKFRTMRVDTEVVDVPLDAAHPGITRVGRFLRSTSIDELPQLINVVRGDMSLIGPRPTIPAQAAEYDAFARRRLEVRPGISGWAQVNGRNTLSWAARIRHDVWYVDNRCFGLDCRIVWRTLKVLARPALAWAGADDGTDTVEGDGGVGA